MKFGPAAPQDCAGAILAHGVYLRDGRIRKGTRLAAADIARLIAAGITSVTVARLEAGDLDEDSAADRLAAALVPDGSDDSLEASFHPSCHRRRPFIAKCSI